MAVASSRATEVGSATTVLSEPSGLRRGRLSVWTFGRPAPPPASRLARMSRRDIRGTGETAVPHMDGATRSDGSAVPRQPIERPSPRVVRRPTYC